MRLASTLAIVAVLFSSSVSSSHFRLDPADGVVLPEEVAQRLLQQCSRDAPRDISRTWLPNKQQIRELEARLPDALDVIALQRGAEYGHTSNFRRQYVGLVTHGRKIIYVNAFPHTLGDPEPNGPPGFRRFDWHRQVVGVCDGGPAFFGVEYDPATERFTHFEFNGIA